MTQSFSQRSLINLITRRASSRPLIGFTNAPCHRCVVSLSLAVAALTWSSDVPGPNTAIRGLVCSYSKASVDASGSESKGEKPCHTMLTPRGRGANCTRATPPAISSRDDERKHSVTSDTQGWFPRAQLNRVLQDFELKRWSERRGSV